MRGNRWQIAEKTAVRWMVWCSMCVIGRTLLMFFFFFQAEDGIRDVAVTGVQTCALPICWIPTLPTLMVPCLCIGDVDRVRRFAMRILGLGRVWTPLHPHLAW